MYSSYSIYLSTMPFGVISIMRFATVSMNSWSCEVISTMPGNETSELLNAWIDSRSRWFVGESRISVFGFSIIIRAIMQRIFSPPDSTLTFL